MSTLRVRNEIDQSVIRSNYRHIRSLLKPECKVIAVVKADAYGHGADHISRLLEAEGADIFAVACLDEAIALRKAGVTRDILILGITDYKEAHIVADYGFIQTADSLQYARALSSAGNIRVHIKVDTGMSRLGLYCHSLMDISAAAADIEAITKLKGISVEGIFTHFADSDGESTTFTEWQFLIFSHLLSALDGMNIKIGMRHCCNSAAILRFPYMQLDAVRAGLILYGLMPSNFVKDDNLKPAMKLIAKVSAVRTLNAGDTVSYGCSYTAEHKMRIAVIAIGYADGLSRLLSEKIALKINGSRACLIGRVCMDMCMVSLGDIKCVPGDDAIIFEDADDINAIAAAEGTINYEILCSLKKRVEIVYK